jgi:prepilin-type N-terminal cleavage/methylation domain-containing protein
MRKTPRHRIRPTSFTLIELLTVIAIIAILVGLTLAAYSGVFKTAARSRAKSEISALAGVLENYKSDNGTYPTPPAADFTSTNTYTSAEPNTSGPYQDSTAFLYQALTGQTNFGDSPPLPTATSGIKIYDTFTRSQLGNYSAGAGQVYLKDPFGNSYGYFPGNGTNAPNSGAGFYDFWSTGGDTTATNTATWINNWNG